MGSPGYYGMDGMYQPASQQPQQQSANASSNYAYYYSPPASASPSTPAQAPYASSEQQSPQDLRQTLTSWLAQSGQQALPYEEGLKYVIREQVVLTVEHFSALKAKTAPFTHNDGRTVTLLQLEGTIPVWYKGTRYNIPIAIWLLEPFPRVAPLVYVTPTRDMIIRPFHSHVDPSGLVSVPYIREWVFQHSSLVDLVQVLCVVFGNETPLYSCQQKATPQQQQQLQPQQPSHQPSEALQQHMSMEGPPSYAYPNTSSSSTAANDAAVPRGTRYDRALAGASGAAAKTQQLGTFAMSALPATVSRGPAQAYSSPDPPSAMPLSTQPAVASPAAHRGEGLVWGGSPTPTTSTAVPGSGAPVPSTGIPGYDWAPGSQPGVGPSSMGAAGASPSVKVDVVDVFRRNAVAALAQRLERDVVEACQEASRKVDSMLGMQQLLRDRRQGVEREVQELQQEMVVLEQALQACLTQANALDTWLTANARVSVGDDVDSIFEPADPLSRQLLDCISSDLAIEDTMYALDRALQQASSSDSGMTSELYLREIRTLAREQFTFRALELRIRQAQRSARVAQMAANAPNAANTAQMHASPPAAVPSSVYPRV